MAKITCAISGINFATSHFMNTLSIKHTEGYYHPIFAASHNTLHTLYSQHCKGLLPPTDSYLLFLSLLHSTAKVRWKHPVTLDPTSSSTKQLVENNIAQLISVINKTNCIKHPAFKQPQFKVTFENSRLEQIANWISAWESNIEDFKRGRISAKQRDSLQQVENRLSYLILSGEEPRTFSHVIANWASIAADFPPHKDEEWKQVIRTCFNTLKMFNTPLSILRDIKEYCECNIEAGSIHFHTLIKTLNRGISNHIDYLGGTCLSSIYTILPSDSEVQESNKKNEAELCVIASKATDKPPVESDYSSPIDFLRAKLAYRVARNRTNKSTSSEIPAKPENKSKLYKPGDKL